MIDFDLLGQITAVERLAQSCPEADVVELLRPILEPVAEAHPTVERARQWCADQRRAHGWHTQDWWTPEGILRLVWMPQGLGVQLLVNDPPSGLCVAASNMTATRSTYWGYDDLAEALTTVYASQGVLL